MESSTTVLASDGSETAPLLGSRNGSSNEAASYNSIPPTNSPDAPRNNTPEAENASGTISNDEPAKPAVKMAALMPALATGIFLVALDQTLTIATYGRIGSELQALNSTSWIATSYFLTLTTFQPLYGKLSDIFGRKACLLFAYAVFGLGCLGCGLARDIVELCVARAVQGVGGGGMNAVVTILVTDLVSLRERGVWQGYINIIWAVGMSTGAPIGGLFADNIGWRWAFILQSPIALIAFTSVYMVLHLPHTDHSHWSAKFLRIDFIGAFTLVSAVFLLLFGLDNGSNEGWDKEITYIPLALTPVLFIVFVLVEAYVAKEPFAPGHVIFDPPLLAAYGANFFGVAGQMGLYFFIALFFQAAVGLSATRSGLVFIPSTLFSLSGSLGGGITMRRTGRFFWLTLTGYCLAILGCVPMVIGAGQRSAIITIAGLAVVALGSSISITSTLIAIIANVAPEDTAVAIACSYLFRSLGTTIGISVTTATLQQMLRVNLAERLGGADRAREIEEQVRLSLDYIRKLDPEVAIIVRKCYAIATQWAFVPVAVFAGLAIVSSLFIKEKKLDR
ncbi:MFS multidrug transporter [Xylaria bambusicola]|uniref:MFS multidrug transporter n=1 Tax=Xylaria bambusicola TaxID=326684 RepID=UPI0020084F9B|nr:MFS multidrug transporter [Xylaria bambusicola]KAI0527798.1 MFS multidrug transporter [Xylaria bambusicola]